MIKWLKNLFRDSSSENIPYEIEKPKYIYDIGKICIHCLHQNNCKICTDVLALQKAKLRDALKERYSV